MLSVWERRDGFPPRTASATLSSGKALIASPYRPLFGEPLMETGPLRNGNTLSDGSRGETLWDAASGFVFDYGTECGGRGEEKRVVES